jgi:hypothetical protein
VAQLNKSPHGLLPIRDFQQDESATGLDLCQYLGLDIPHLKEFKHHECPYRYLAIDTYGDHLHCCTQHAEATQDTHEHILSALQRLFTKAGYRTDRKNVPHSRGLKKEDLWIKDFQLAGVRNVIVDVTLRHEFHGSCANLIHHGEPSHHDVNGALDAAVKEKLDNFVTNLQRHDYNESNFFGRHDDLRENQRDCLRLLYVLSHRQAANYYFHTQVLRTSHEKAATTLNETTRNLKATTPRNCGRRWGSRWLKRRHLELLGHALVPVPYWE